VTDEDVEDNLEQAFDLAHEVIEDPDGYPDEFVAFHLGDETLLRILTRERLRLLRMVRDEGPFESIAELARTLDRDPSRVGRDLSWLAETGLVRLEKRGRSKTVEGTDRKILLA
jgi:predicted transcriptional regulator